MNVTLCIPFSRTTLRGLYVTITPSRKFFGRFSGHGYSSFGLGFATVQWLP